MCDEQLNLHWWDTVGEAQDAVTVHQLDYNEGRPPTALGNRAPNESAQRHAKYIKSQRLASQCEPRAGSESATHSIRRICALITTCGPLLEQSRCLA